MSAKGILKIKVLGDASDLEKKLDGVSGSLANFGKMVAGAVAVKQVADYFTEAAKAGAEEEQQIQRLSKALADNAGVTEDGMVAVEEWVAATQRATATADNELREALLKLSSTTKDAGKAQEILTTALDISSARGLDLNTVVVALEKGYQGNVGGLQRLGIATKDASGKTLSFDQVMKNAVKTYGGAAAQAADTTAGKMKNLSLMFGDMKEEVGKALLPVIDRFVKILMDNMPAIQSLMMAVSKAIAAIAPVFEPLLQIAAKLLTAVTPLVEKVTQILIDNMPSIVKLFDGLMAIIDALMPILTAALSVIGDVIGWVASLVGSVAEGIAKVVEFFVGLPGKLKDGLSSIWQTISQPFVDAWNAVSGFFTDTLGPGIKTFFTETLPEKIKEGLDKLYEWIVQPFVNLWTNHLGPWFSETWDKIKGFFVTTLPEKIKAGLSKLYEWIVQPFVDVWTKHLGPWFTETWDKIKTFFTDTLPEKISAGFTAIYDAIKKPFKDAYDWIDEHVIGPLYDFWEWLTGLFASDTDRALQKAREERRAIESYQDPTGGTYLSAPGGAVGYASGGPIPGAPGQPIPILAHGGEYMLTRGDMTALGKMLVGGMKGTSITVNITGQGASAGQAAADALLTRLAAAGVSL